MALFKILHGDTSRISMDITPFHEGYCYVTYDGHMYIDMNLGTESEPDNQRIKLSAKDAETITGASLATILNSSDIEIPTSKAVLDALENAKTYVDNAVAQKTQVQMATSDNGMAALQTLKIHKMTKEQYDEALENGTIDENALYLTPDEDVDLSDYATIEQLNSKSDVRHNHTASDVTDLQSVLDDAIDTAKTYIDNAVSNKSDSTHSHDDRYYTESEVDTKLDEKSQVQMITSEGSEHLSTLNIRRVSKEQYEADKANGTLDATALYLIPDEETDLSSYVTQEVLDSHTGDTAVHITADERSKWNSAYELANNKVASLSDLGITATAAELNYMAGATSNVQTQLDNKAQVQIITWEADD